MSVEIQLTRGYVAIVDDCDADLAELKWYASVRKNKTPYAGRNLRENGTHTYPKMHRVILERMLQRPLAPGELCDHIDHNGLNNSRANLRVATSLQNAWNQKPRKNVFGLMGVAFHKKTKKFSASIRHNGKKLHLGLFLTPIEAHEAYCEAARKFRGEFAGIK